MGVSAAAGGHGTATTPAVSWNAEPPGKFAVLHAFLGGADGANPYAGVIKDKAGNLYGTTMAGGGGGGGNGSGVVYQLAPDGTQTVFPFDGGSEGKNPEAPLIMDSAGNLYGTTYAGGAYGFGTVFKLAWATGTETVLHSFASGSGDGANPVAGLIRDASGNLYGMTSAGGDEGGVIFKIAPDSTETLLHNFFGGDGCVPLGGLIADKAGNFYGSTRACGAAGVGTTFKLAPDGTYTVLYSFGSLGPDGEYPSGGLVRDGNGNLYGTTEYGSGTGCGGSGCGTVFEVTPKGKETILYQFTGGSDGQWPLASLVRDGTGNLYGMTKLGGGTGGGTVFKIATDGSETILHAFTGGNDGSSPVSGLIAKRTNLFGTASSGGAHGFGTVFKVAE
ncbi:MAG TPA: choice-of-anchor tandem repeat GloVer-containing protein [Rhizomicrobium sp.]|jgi:uncharacterized repeat protein (TIGR03803 family)|nr:choice-of-anchor tandem repeat GloVer-containing protein [Rhizomicrobium sp.]